MKSIRANLVASLVVAAFLLSLLTGGGLFLSIRHSMHASFDQLLKIRAQGIQSLAAMREDGSIDLDFQPNAFTNFSGTTPLEYFQIQDARGKTVLKSWAGETPATFGRLNDGLSNIGLPGDRAGRALQVRFTPSLDADDAGHGEARSQDQAEPSHIIALMPLTLAVVRDEESLLRSIYRLGGLIAGATAALSLSLVVATVFIVRHGLRHLDRLAVEVTDIDIRRAGTNITPHQAPLELQPIISRLNEMLTRVRATLQRERRFSANVAHELRTPLAELRVAADVAQRMPSNLAMQHRAVRQARDIAMQMQSMVTTLSKIVHNEDPRAVVELTPVPVTDVLKRVITRHADLAASRHLTIAPPTAVRAFALADEVLLTAVFDNLIGNALQYAPPDTEVKVDMNADGDRVQVCVSNDDATLIDSDLDHLFEPFWRKDAARSSGQHVGLGLALTRTYCDAMRAPINVGRTLTGQLSFTVSLATCEHQAESDSALLPPLAPVVREHEASRAVAT